MLKTVKATYSKGVLTPLEPLALEEGAEATVSIDVRPEMSEEERRLLSRAAVGAWKGKIDGEELKRTLYEARMSGSRDQSEL